MTKPNKRTVTVSNKPSLKSLKTMLEVHLHTLVILTEIDGLPPKAKAYNDQAVSLLAQTFDDLRKRYEAQSKKTLDLSYITDAFVPTQETKTDDQDTTQA